MKRFILSMALVFVSLNIFAQTPPVLPLDPKVKTGKLENGLTYFVMQNAEPKGQAEFYIAQKVGSILEEENQRGLAHFLEHMAFNGTKNYPGNKVISYLETIGVKFGANLNAYTAIDQTVYNISAVPLKREGIVDSCLLILHDWANEILLEEEDIDKERGVIREELRTRNNAQMRMLENLLPEILPDSKYAHRLPGGLVEVINTFTYQELRDYYEKWYRPDLQGIIVVGDIDPAVIEQKIVKMFSDIPKPVNAAERTEFEVPDNTQPLIGIASDPEATSTSVMLMFKKDAMPKELRPTATSLVFGFMNNMVSSMLNSRLSDITQKANAPFMGARASYGDFIVSNTKQAFDLSANAKDGGLESAVTALAQEAEKVRRFGFTESELERAKANYTSWMEQIYKEREKQKSDFFVQQILNHFLTGEAYPGIEAEYAMMQQIMPMITLEQINAYAMSLPTKENMVLAVMMPEKEGLQVPTKEELLSVYNKAVEAELEPYQETVSNEPLISETPAIGKVVSEVNEPMSNSTIWNLSNGATVVVKKTDFKEDQILFSASSKGGYSLFDINDIVNSKVVSDLISIGGLGNFSSSDLRKVLAGKNVSISSSVGLTSESVSGKTTPKDLETFMQLLYLNFTSIRKDDEAFQSWYSRMEAQLKNAEANPMTAFTDSLRASLYNNSPYATRFKLEMLDKVDYERALNLGRERFANAADFVFTFVGNIDEAQLKTLAETYIGSLPANKGRKENWNTVDYNYAKGTLKNEFQKEMQTPKSSVYSIFSGQMPYTIENIILSQMASQVFDMVFTRTIREQEQGTYGVGVDMSLSHYPNESYSFLFGFDTDVALKERLLKRAYTEIDNVVEQGVAQEDFNKIIEYMNKNYTQNLRENSYWLSVINSRFLIGKDMHTTYKTALDAVTPQKLHEFIKQMVDTDNRLEVIMNGVAPESK
ncbi:MAG: M16 family metallopeptidase [Bacteroidales bacterium]